MSNINSAIPEVRFSPSRIRRAGIADDDVPRFRDRADRLPNLQLLAGEANESKRDKLPRQWLDETFEARGSADHAERHLLGDVPADMTGFDAFYEARRDLLLASLRQLLGSERREAGAQ